MADDKMSTQESQQSEEREIIYIPDEDGNEEEFEVVMTFEVEDTGTNYMMVIPVDGEDESDEVYAFRFEEEGEELKLFTIDDEAEWAMVEETFNTLMSEAEEE